MHIWRIEKLAEKLASGALSEWEKARYLVGSAVLHILTSYSYAIFRAPPYKVQGGTLSTVLGFVAELAVTTVGFIVLFNVHSRRSNAGFLDKAVCFALPAAIRAFVVGWGSLGVLLLFLGLASRYPSLELVLEMLVSLGPLFAAILFSVLHFVYMYSGFSAFNEHKAKLEGL